MDPVRAIRTPATYPVAAGMNFTTPETLPLLLVSVTRWYPFPLLNRYLSRRLRPKGVKRLVEPVVAG